MSVHLVVRVGEGELPGFVVNVLRLVEVDVAVDMNCFQGVH